MKYTYHYHAMAQKAINEIIHIDGIVVMNTPIKAYKNYHEFKKTIVDEDLQNIDYNKITISNLSLLHTE